MLNKFPYSTVCLKIVKMDIKLIIIEKNVMNLMFILLFIWLLLFNRSTGSKTIGKEIIIIGRILLLFMFIMPNKGYVSKFVGLLMYMYLKNVNASNRNADK